MPSDEEMKAAIAILHAGGYDVTAPQDTDKWGCHCDLFAMPEDFQPDGCVIDEGAPERCVYAAEAGCKENCKYWQRITPQSIRAARGE